MPFIDSFMKRNPNNPHSAWIELNADLKLVSEHFHKYGKTSINYYYRRRLCFNNDIRDGFIMAYLTREANTPFKKDYGTWPATRNHMVLMKAKEVILWTS